MNDRGFNERLIEGLAEVKGELVAQGQKIEFLDSHIRESNNTMTRHIADDLVFQAAQLVWQTAQTLRQEKSESFRKGLLWPVGSIFLCMSILGPLAGYFLRTLIFGS